MKKHAVVVLFFIQEPLPVLLQDKATDTNYCRTAESTKALWVCQSHSHKNCYFSRLITAMLKTKIVLEISQNGATFGAKNFRILLDSTF